jgi:hypothetical protein
MKFYFHLFLAVAFVDLSKISCELLCICVNIQKIILSVLVLHGMKETGCFFIASADAHAQQNDKVSKITKIIEKNRFITKVYMNIFLCTAACF